MRKLKLDIDELKVESFATAAAAPRGGTVQARYGGGEQTITQPPGDSDFDCNTLGTCIGPTYCCVATWKPSCADTCINTCAGDSCGNFCTWNPFVGTCASCINTCVGPTCEDQSICPICTA